jgi:hypothetical protein
MTRQPTPGRRPGPVFPALAASVLALLACSPTVGVKAPEEPIVINMNIKIEHEIRVKVEKDLEEAFEENEEIF